MNLIKMAIVAGALSAILITTQAAPGLAADQRIASQVDAKALSKKKQTRLGLYVTAAEAAQLLKAHPDILLLDVRTRAEMMFVGMPTVAAKNIPFVDFGSYAYDEKKKTYKLDANPAFASEVEKLVAAKGGSKSTTLILMCRSGTRSAKAANELAKLGYANVYTMVDGFEGDKDSRRPAHAERLA